MCKCHDLNYVISPYIILPLLDASGTTGAENCLGRKTVWAIDLSCSRSGASPYRLFKQIPTALTCPLQVITTIDNSFHFTTFTKKKKNIKKTTMKVNHYLKLFGYPYDIFFCVQNNNVNDDRIVILG